MCPVLRGAAVEAKTVWREKRASLARLPKQPLHA
jgi:hypothetical protein